MGRAILDSLYSTNYCAIATGKGILETDMPHVVPVYGDDSDTAASRQEGWSCVSAGKAVPDGILFTCFDSKPDAEIPIQIEVMR